MLHRIEYNQAKANLNAIQYTLGLQTKQIRSIQQQWNYALDCVQSQLRNIEQVEEDLGIEQRWTKGMPDCDAVVEEWRLREYRKALDKLEYVVVQHMFELTKMSMSGVGE